ncbi:MAG: NusA N-terminal domain-containing protein [candidate division KSB1 bacterium]|nr:NusA N-terminal domain-containing protein [candidate division KSB1 bacterium]
MEEIIESIMLSMIKKKYGHADNFDIFVNLDKGEIEIYQNKTVVETVTDPVKEIDLESARKVEPSLEIGDPYLEIIDPASFGRRLIISAKQNLNQRIRDVEKEHIYEEYSKKVGEIVIGDIRQINHGDVFINIDKIEVKLPRSEQIPTERYRRGETIRAIVKGSPPHAQGAGNYCLARRSANAVQAVRK